ncbi:response regulator [Aquiflexum sp.]|uniref:response regulator transcription factor n=1 Tax=Aquiflexum sp. TaxID=1872584 RepID=UPI003593808C
MSKNIIIVDDHDLFASGLISILSKNPDYSLIGQFNNGKKLVDYLDSSHSNPDLVTLDLNMPIMDGVQCLGYIQRHFPKLKVIVISMHQTIATINLCERLGAYGFVGKNSPLKVLLNAIEKVLDGEKFFDKEEAENQKKQPDGFYKNLIQEYNLSKREVDIIQLIINQFESNEIADKLNLSPLTVKTHRKNIFRKLGVRNLTGLVSIMRQQPGY